MTPPFLGTKVLDGISLDSIEPFVDRETLFASRWEFRKNITKENWEQFKKDNVAAIYERIISNCHADNLIQPRAVYGYFKCRKIGNGILVEGEHRSHRFDFPRERVEPHRCLADFFPDGYMAFQLVTIGNKVTKRGSELFAEHAYSDMFYLKGFASEATEALAKFCHKHIRNELGVSENIGERFSPGYPSFPNLLDQKTIAALLRPIQIGVTITVTCQLVPEHSTSAIISADPRAQHFRP